MYQSIKAEAAIVAGVSSHLFYFIRGEHHLRAPKIVRVYLSLIFLAFVLYLRHPRGNYAHAAAECALISTAYFGSLFGSMVIYRIFFHKLRRFPGPKLARITKLYHAFQIRRSDQYLWMERLHQRYGDFVRTGPNELAIFDPKAIPAIHGPNSKCVKAAWYDNILPRHSVVTTRSRTSHDVRRKVWDQGFSTKALQKHEVKILDHANLVDGFVSGRLGEAINASALFEYYGFDVMGDVGYNKSFGMLRDQKSHYAIDTFKGGITVLGTMTPVPWLIHVVFSLPLITRGWDIYNSWADQELQNRLQIQPDQQDTIGWLIDAGRENPDREENHQWLMGDFITLVTGGSEPVISTIIYLFYHLAISPHDVSKLRDEIKDLPSYSDTINLQNLSHLNGLIYETLRLHPPIPSGGLRTTPETGISVGETHIPGNTTVLTPHYSLGRREDCFRRATEFIPERWYSKPELILDRTAFIPFGTGHYSCVGRNLGLMEIRTLTTLLFDKYDVRLADGDDGTRLHRDTLDCFATSVGKLELEFRKRT